MPGEPTRTLVLLPGLDGTGLLFRSFLASTPPDVDARVLPLPQDGAMDYATLAGTMRARLPSDRPFVLLGESFSGPLALALAALDPPGLLGVILCVTFVAPPAWSILRHGVSQWLFRLRPPTLGLRLFLSGGETSSDLIADLRAARGTAAPRATAARLRTALSCDACEALRACPVPVFALHARRDWMVPRSAAEHMRRARPGLDEVTLDGPHLLLQTAPGASWAAILGFLEAGIQADRWANTSSTCA